MPHICRLNLFDFEDGEELVFAEFEEGVAFAAVELFQIEDILVKRDRLVDVINLDRDVIASIHLHAHFLIYICRTRAQNVRSTWMSSVVVDLRENFYAHRGWFFSLGCGAVVVSIAKEFVLDHRLPSTTNLAFQLIFAATLLIGALTRSERYHKRLIVFGSALFVFYFVVLYARMR